MSAGRHQAPRPSDPFLAAVVLALASLLTVIVALAVAGARSGS
jgi:hypothetical protein